MRTRPMEIVSFLALWLAATAVVGCGSGDAPGQGGSPAPAGQREQTIPLPGQEAPEGELPPGHPPLEGSQGTGQISGPAPGAGTGANALIWTLPESWVEEQPSSSVRRAQFRVPGEAGDAECVVFYFGPGQGGEPMANAMRWANQFGQPDGSNPLDKLQTRQETINGMQVLRVETTGTYENPMTDDGPIEDALLLASIVDGPDARWFFKLTGPRATVEPQRSAFEEFLRSLRPGGRSGP